MKAEIEIDPSIVRFTHSRIRPFFTGCSKRITDTLDEIRGGLISVEDLPMITVIENRGQYFSLNNRRLFVLKALRSEGLLKNNSIRVRLKPALEREKERYTTDRCSLVATIMKELGDNTNLEQTADPEKLSSTEEVATTENEEEPVVESKSKSSKPPKKAPPSLPLSVLQSLKSLTALVEKGKSKKALEKIRSWVQDGTLTADQAPLVEAEIGI